MSVLEILKWPDPRLWESSEPVGDIDESVRALASDMLETMYAAPGRGLAAPQVGVLKRLFVMDIAWKEAGRDPLVFVDPEITWRSDEVTTGSEGCLSIPGIVAEVERAAAVEVRWRDLSGRTLSERFDGFAAICIQHEYDHLDGVVTFDRVSADQRERMEAAYERAIE